MPNSEYPRTEVPLCDGDVMCNHKACWDDARQRVRKMINDERRARLGRIKKEREETDNAE